MGKLAVVFPGQGSQFVGMGKDIEEKYDVAKKIFEASNKALDFDMKNLMFNGPMEELTKTENTQPAILTHCIAILKVLQEKIDLKADFTAGLSLGEYASLVYSDSIKFEDAVKLVKKRGRYMQEAVPQGVGSMAAILGMERETLETTLKELEEEGKVLEAANFNSPGQIVISGTVEMIEKALPVLKERGAKKAVQLSVSAPFHCSLLKPAGEKLEEEMTNIDFKDGMIPVYCNVDASITNSQDLKQKLVKQVSSSVLWEDIIEDMIDRGTTRFVEVGPGKTLKSFIKKIAQNKGIEVEIFTVDTVEAIEEFVNEMKGE